MTKNSAVRIVRRKRSVSALIDSRGDLYTNRLGDPVLFPTPEWASAVADREMREEGSRIFIVTQATLTWRALP